MRSPLASARPAFLQESRPQAYSGDSALLLEFFLARLQHLIVGGFLDAAVHKMFAYRFLFLIHAGSRNAVTSRRRGDIPIIGQPCILFGFLRWSGMLRAKKLLARLGPIGLSEFVWIALIDRRNFSRAFLNVFWRGHAHAVPMQRDFSRAFL